MPSPTDQPKVPILISYAHLRHAPEDWQAWMLSNPKVEILLDCGAFTALNVGEEVLLDDYMRYLEKWREHLFGYIALDVIGDPQATNTNLDIMLKEGFDPIPVHVRGDGQKRMDELFERSSWVACGGLRRPHRGHCSRSYLYQKHAWARGRNVHWLGYTKQEVVFDLKPYSIDCSNYAAGVRWGKLAIYNGNCEWTREMTIGHVLSGVPRTRTMTLEKALRRSGFTMADLRNPKRWRQDVKREPLRDFMMLHLCAESWVSYVRDVRAAIGTRAFIAVAPIHGRVEALYHYIDQTDTTGADRYDNPVFG